MRSFLSLIGDTIFPAICVVGIAYNFLVMVNAPEGIRMKFMLEQKIVTEQARLDALKERHAHLSSRADRLLTTSLDKDLLEERVRSVLGLVDRGEYMVRLEDLDRLASLRPAQEAVPVRFASVVKAAR